MVLTTMSICAHAIVLGPDVANTDSQLGLEDSQLAFSHEHIMVRWRNCSHDGIEEDEAASSAIRSSVSHMELSDPFRCYDDNIVCRV